MKDPNWWQAKHIGQNEVTGLIPSQELEERRKAFVPPEADFVHTISICGTKVTTVLFYNYNSNYSNNRFVLPVIQLLRDVISLAAYSVFD